MCKYLKSFIVLVVSIFALGSVSEIQAQKISGQEFWFTLPKMSPLNGNVEGLFLYVVSDYCIDEATIEIPGLGYSENFEVDRGSYTELKIPITIGGTPVYHNRTGQIEDKGIFIKTEFPVVVYAATYEAASVDGEIMLPVDMLGERYVISNRGTLIDIAGNALKNVVVATEDNTDVEIQTWNSAGNPDLIKVNLNKGETYMFSINRGNCPNDYPRGSYAPCINLNGSIVTSTKPVAITGSMDCSGGFECGACENTFITFQPEEDWGTHFVTAQITPRNRPLPGNCNRVGDVSGDYIDVVGPVGTTVTVQDRSGTRSFVLQDPPYNAGANYGYGYEFIEVAPETGLGATDFGFANTVITSDNPIQVTQWPKGWQTDNQGSSDPEALMVYPTKTWESSYIFAILNTATTLNNDFTIIVENVGTPAPIDNFEYDDGNGGAPQNINNIAGSTAWTQIGSTNYYYKRVPTVLAINTLRVYSRTGQKFGIYTSSRGQAESYMQNGGDGPILEIPVCPICPSADFIKKEDVCIGQTAEFTDASDDDDESGTTSIVQWDWDFGDGTTETYTTSTNPTHVYTTPGVYNVTLSVTNDNANPGPCTLEITKQITVFDGPSANAGPDFELCFGESVVIGGTPTGTGGEGVLTYSWSPTSGIPNSTSSNPRATPTSTETYTVAVEDEDGCIGTDEVLLTVFPKDSAFIADASYTVCSGNSVDVKIDVVGGNSSTYTVKVSNASVVVTEAALPSNGGVVNVPWNAGFPNGFNVNITSFKANDPDICTVFDVVPIPVNVRQYPDPSFQENQITLCEGEQTTVMIDFAGSGVLDFEIFDGTDVENITGNNSNPYTFNVNPTVSTTYTVRNVRYSNAPNCPSTETSVLDVIVEENPDPGQDASISVCAGGDKIDLFSLLGSDADMGGTWTDNSANTGTLTADNKFDTEAATDGEYEFVYTVSSSENCPKLTATVTIDYNEPPKFRDLVEDCSDQLQDYKVRFTAFGGDPSSYTSPDGTFTGGSFVSNQDYLTKTPYTITFDDANGCGPVTIDGFKNCGCFTHAGTMNSTVLEYCESDSAYPQFNNDHVLVTGKPSGMPDDTLYFVLHEGSGLSIVSPIDSAATPAFAFKAGMVYGRTYYVSPVAGEPLANGGIDYDPQGCISVGQGTPIKFFEKPTLSTQAIEVDLCPGELAQIKVNFTGAGPYNLESYSNKNDTTGFGSLTQVDTIAYNPDTTILGYTIFEIGDKYCRAIAANASEQFQVHQSPDTVPGSYVFNCTNDALFYTVGFQLTGDVATLKVSPSTAGTIDATGYFTSNPIANHGAYSFTFTDQYNCGAFVISKTEDCPCLSDAGSFVETSVSVCEYDQAVFTHNGNSFNDANDDSLYIIYSDPANPLTSILLEKNSPSFGIQAPMLPNTTYYFSMVMGNQSGGGGVDYVNDTCVSVSPAVPFIFNATPSATFVGAEKIDTCRGVEFLYPYTFTGAAPFSFEYKFDNGPTGQTYNFTNSPDTFRFTPTKDTTFIISTITDANNCTAAVNDTLIANVLPSPTVTLQNTNDTTVCFGETIPLKYVVTRNGRYSMEIIDQITNTQLKRIPVGVQDAFTTNITANADMEAVVINVKDQVCTGVGIGTKKIFVTALPELTFTGANDVCENDSATATYEIVGGIPPYNIEVVGTGSYSNIFTSMPANGSIKLPGSVVGQNQFEAIAVTDSSPIKACNGIGGTVSYVVNPLPTATITGAEGVCVGDSIPVYVNIAGSGNDFSLDVTDDRSNEKTFRNLTAGDNTVYMPANATSGTVVFFLDTVTDFLTCSNLGTGSASSVQYNKPQINFSFNGTHEACNPVNLEVYPNIVTPNNSVCTWTFEDGQQVTGCNQDFTVDFFEDGNYDLRVEVITEQGCFADTVFTDTVKVQPVPVADFRYSPEEPSNIFNHVSFTNLSQKATRYLWRIGEEAVFTTQHVEFDFPIIANRSYDVSLQASTEFGCVDSIVKTVRVKPELIFYIPNSFTPNNDGLNEVFKPVVTLPDAFITDYQLLIFNRWGEQMFFSSDITVGWDGTFNGNQVRPGGYTYRVKATVGEGNTAESVDLHGMVLIVH